VTEVESSRCRRTTLAALKTLSPTTLNCRSVFLVVRMPAVVHVVTTVESFHVKPGVKGDGKAVSTARRSPRIALMNGLQILSAA